MSTRAQPRKHKAAQQTWSQLRGVAPKINNIRQRYIAYQYKSKKTFKLLLSITQVLPGCTYPDKHIDKPQGVMADSARLGRTALQ